MRCLVTGGTGFIGAHIVKKLLREKLEVAVLLRSKNSYWRIKEYEPNLKLLYGDLSNISAISEEIKIFSPEVVIHAGWGGVTKSQRNDFDQQIKTNLFGSLEFIKICADTGCSIWIGLGSQAEYGSTNKTLFEGMDLRPDTLYGSAKMSLGKLSEVFCNAAGIRQVWFRLTAAYGPLDDINHLIPYTITTLLKGETPALTRAEQRWDYLYIDDVVSAIWIAIQKQDVKGIYNLSAGKATEIRKLCEFIRDHINPNLPLGFNQLSYGVDERMILLADNHRFCQTSGWAPAISLEEGLESTISWYTRQMLNL